MTIYRGRSYLDKHRFTPRAIPAPPSSLLKMLVTIPCHNEAHLLATLTSLEACAPPPCAVEILILLNSHAQHSQAIHDQNAKTLSEVEGWVKEKTRTYTYHLLHFPHLPRKHAGVGLARKIAMDEAVDRLEQAGNPRGVILGLDADTTIATNYLQAVWDHFQNHPDTEAASIYFEHPLSGEAYESRVYEGIVRYELFLRYYIEGLRLANYPFAYHTIGSSMAVRSSAYQKQGGMNRRKAGEDFYFLHKFIAQGTLSEIQDTSTFPSPRPSDKVPFGTGKAILQWLGQESSTFSTYHPQTFNDLTQLCTHVKDLYRSSDILQDLPSTVQGFFEDDGWEDKLEEIRSHVTSQPTFVKRFYQKFDALRVLKFVHFCQDVHYPKVEIQEAATELQNQVFPQKSDDTSLPALLYAYRKHQRSSRYQVPL